MRYLDPAFGNALDCLIYVDLRRMPANLLQKYMSPDAMQSFRAYWRLPAVAKTHAA